MPHLRPPAPPATAVSFATPWHVSDAQEKGARRRLGVTTYPPAAYQDQRLDEARLFMKEPTK